MYDGYFSFWLSIVTRLIFGMKPHFIDTYLLIPRSRSSAKVKVIYHGHITKKKKKKKKEEMAVSGGINFSKHIFFL